MLSLPGAVGPACRQRILNHYTDHTEEQANMDEETKALLRNIAHHLKWVIVLLVAILALLVAESL